MTRTIRRRNLGGGVIFTALATLLLLSGCQSGSHEFTGSKATGKATAAGSGLCSSTAQSNPTRSAGSGAYTVGTDLWNGSGTLCVALTGGTGFTVTATSEITSKSASSPVGYPNIKVASGTSGLPLKAAGLSTLTSDWTAETLGISGSYDVAYDLWYSTDRSSCSASSSAELMIWLNSTNSVAPIGTLQADTTVIGTHHYKVYESAGTGSHTVITYRRTMPTNEVHALDLRRFTQDAITRGYVPSSSYLCAISAGFEIWHGGVGLTSKTFDVKT